MMKEVLVRVGEELLIERKTREGTEENILVLIEGMYDKVSPSDRGFFVKVTQKVICNITGTIEPRN